jgi:diguanylate cyclase (GGDEF)-like protein
VHRIVSSDLKDEFVGEARTRARQFAVSVENGATSAAAAEGMMRDALFGGQIAYAELLLDNGDVLPRSAVIRGRLRGTFVEDLNFDDRADNVFYVSEHVNPQARILRGTLRLGFDKRPALERVEQLYRRTLLLVIGYLAVSLTLAGFAGGLLGRSIRRLSDAARRVAGGKSDEALDVPTDITEVASLTHDLELMRGELVRQRRALHSLAYFDGLTGLANRVGLSERLTSALITARERHEKVAVLYVDLDRFKRVNDTLGHDAGDRLLRSVGNRMKACLQENIPGIAPSAASEISPEDAVGRLGGDEFAILLPGITTANNAGAMADRILEALCEPIRIGEHRVYATASIGVAVYPLDGDEPQVLLKNADTAMYHAKQKGKNCFQYYSGAMNVTAATRLELESDLHRALELGQLCLHFQPQTEVESGALTGAEALLRWQHPKRGLIGPGEFIHIAEESGLILEIGEWVIRAACAQLRIWQHKGLPLNRISVNVAARQFEQTSFLSTVKKALEDFGVGRGMLDLEITETSLMTNEAETLERLGGLRDIGVRLSIDDFGTGFSSLSYLKRFAVECLKIDQSFVQDVPENAHNAAIVKAIMALAASLNLDVIAEGVETRRQWQFLRDHGCREMQGYLVSRPLAVDAFEKYVQQMPQVGRPGRLYGVKV